MKVGDKLYSLIYWERYDARFQYYTHIITKINAKTIEVLDYNRKVSKLRLGYDFFTSKKELYKYYIERYKENIKPTLKAIKLLENRLKNER